MSFSPTPIGISESRMTYTPDLKKVDNLLEAWAEWVCSDGYKLGYPTEAAFAHNTPSDLENFRVTEGGDELIAIDRNVAKLDNRLRRVVKYEYLFRGPIEVKARNLGISRRTFRRWLKEAKYRLASAMAAETTGLRGIGR